MKEYAYIYNVIEQCLALDMSQRTGIFNKYKEVDQLIKDKQIKLNDLYRHGGYHNYEHNRYLISCFYHYLGECYDFEKNPQLARHYYLLSEHSVAKWRLARLYLNGCLSITGDVQDKVDQCDIDQAQHLIMEAITMMIRPVDDLTHFTNRITYLVEMYGDLIKNFSDDRCYSIYFDVLKWIIDHRRLYNVTQKPNILTLLSYQIPKQKKRNQVIYNLVQDLVYQKES
jgi:hypothetical protein